MMCGISLNPLARFVETLNQKSAGCMWVAFHCFGSESNYSSTSFWK
jgi:hypothetical protein